MAKFEFERVNQRWVVRKLYRRKESPYYYGHVRDERAGKVHWLSTGETNKRRARQFLTEWIEEREEREKQEAGGRARFETAFEEYLNDLNVREVTIAGYRRDFERVYVPHFARKFLDEVTKRDVKDFLKWRKESSSRTRQKHLTALRSFFRWAIDEGYLKQNPCNGVKVERGEKRKGVALTAEDAHRLLQAAKEPEVREFNDHRRRNGWKQKFEPPQHLFVALAIFLLTGLRRKNVLGMTWRHVDLAKGRISFPAEEMKGKADHEVPIHSQLLALFRSLLVGRKKIDLDKPVVGGAFKSIATSFKAAVRRAGLPEGLRLHDLRHSWASWLAPNCSYPCLQELLGHSPGNMVTLAYTHAPWQERVQAVEQLPDLLRPVEEEARRLQGER